MLSAWQQEVKKLFQQTHHRSEPQAGKVKVMVPPSTHQSQGSSPGGSLHYPGGSGTAKGAVTPSHLLRCVLAQLGGVKRAGSEGAAGR